MLTHRIDDLTRKVFTLTNELAEEKSEIYIKNSRLTALEELKVASDARIRFERPLVRSLQAQADV